MADPAEKVRVKDVDTKHEYTITRARLESTPEAFTELDKPALDVNGNDLPPKHYLDLAAVSTGYESQTAQELSAEVVRRNAERDVDSQVSPEGRSKADLVAALVADDTRTADATTATTEES